MSYSKKVIQERIKKLLETPRVYWSPLSYENKVDGLVDLAKKYITDKDFVVEVGSFSGVSSQVLALHCKELHCIDPYHWEAVIEAEKMFDKMLLDYSNITKVKKLSIEGSKDYADNSIDVVYIDGDHSYSSVVEDINAWKNKVKKGGYIAGHDSFMPEVLQAVKDTLGEPLETFDDTSWIIKIK